MLIAFKLKLALVCAAGLAGPLSVAPLLNETAASDKSLRDPQAFVELQPGTVSYRVAGDFTRAAKQAEAPLTSVRFDAPAFDHEAPGLRRRLSALRRRRPAAAR